jgi:phage terminase large subunit GpA-like protein
MIEAATLYATVRQAWRPPLKMDLSAWIESFVRLPSVASALPGPVKLFRYQKGIADAISDSSIVRITLVKSAQVGFSTVLTATIGHFVVNDPSAILCLLPTEADARGYMVSDVDPIFQATPCLRVAMTVDKGEDDRNTLLSRRFSGGSLKVVAAHAPRNLRRHVARFLLIDEADACEVSTDGDPIELAEKRTLTFSNRKIIIGSTPKFLESSAVLKAYAESDQRVFECPCPECGAYTEILWQHIVWEADKPETAAFKCPHCEALIEERHKPAMVESGHWRITKPDVQGHAGFRWNALVSTLPNCRWPILAASFLTAKRLKDQGDPAKLQAFINTVLGQGWGDGAEMVDEADLITRIEPIGLDRLPNEALVIVAGIDVQDDRLEVSLVAFDKHDVAYVLAHVILWGSPDDDTLWQELDELLRTRWRHPYGGSIGVDATAIDSGDGEWTQRVYDFAFPRTSRRIMAIKGMFGSRPVIQISKGKVATRRDGRGGEGYG